MNHYIVDITFNDPYPKLSSFRVGSASMGTALNRAFKLFRAENKGRKIGQLSIKIVKV